MGYRWLGSVRWEGKVCFLPGSCNLSSLEANSAPVTLVEILYHCCSSFSVESGLQHRAVP